MKSTASLIGIIRLAGMAMELEEAARCGNTEIIRMLHPVFVSNWRDYKNELAVLFTEDTNLKKAAEHKDAILEIFESIRDAADNMDVDTLDEMSRKLDEFSFDGSLAEKVEKVKNDIFNFNVENLVNCAFE